jgi:hypothetical protein
MIRFGRRAMLALAALLAACQPLPHPFEDDKPPAALVKIPDGAGVAIAPIEGEPAAVATKLGAAVAKGLLKRDILASDKTPSLGGYVLHGGLAQSRPREGTASVTVFWRLTDAQGRAVGERTAKLEAKTAELDGAKDDLVDRLAALSVNGLAPLLENEAPVKAAAAQASDDRQVKAAAVQPSGDRQVKAAGAQPADDRRLKVAVKKISGAPGDGGTSLAAAVSIVLKRQDLAVVEEGGKADLVVEGEVAISPVKANKQHVKIVWRVKRADGVEIGTVGMENDVPKGMLDGAWGDLAYTVALAAGEGLLQLVARGAPAPAKS